MIPLKQHFSTGLGTGLLSIGIAYALTKAMCAVLWRQAHFYRRAERDLIGRYTGQSTCGVTHRQ